MGVTQAEFRKAMGSFATGVTVITVDHEELAEARWWSRAGLVAALQAGELALPPSVSIARHIIEAWYGAPLPSTWTPPPRS